MVSSYQFLEPGDRVGIILKEVDNHVKFLGYGVFLGLSEFDDGREYPEFKLDDGNIFFGNECTWLEEKKMTMYLSNRKIVFYRLDIDDENEVITPRPMQ